jgi:hypothetical protein
VREIIGMASNPFYAVTNGYSNFIYPYNIELDGQENLKKNFKHDKQNFKENLEQAGKNVKQTVKNVKQTVKNFGKTVKKLFKRPNNNVGIAVPVESFTENPVQYAQNVKDLPPSAPPLPGQPVILAVPSQNGHNNNAGITLVPARDVLVDVPSSKSDQIIPVKQTTPDGSVHVRKVPSRKNKTKQQPYYNDYSNLPIVPTHTPIVFTRPRTYKQSVGTGGKKKRRTHKKK